MNIFKKITFKGYLLLLLIMTGLSLASLIFSYFQLVNYRATTLDPIKQFCDEHTTSALSESKKLVDELTYKAKCSWLIFDSDLSEITLYERQLNQNLISTVFHITIPLVILIFMSLLTRRLLTIDYANKSIVG